MAEIAMLRKVCYFESSEFTVVSYFVLRISNFPHKTGCLSAGEGSPATLLLSQFLLSPFAFPLRSLTLPARIFFHNSDQTFL